MEKLTASARILSRKARAKRHHITVGEIFFSRGLDRKFWLNFNFS